MDVKFVEVVVVFGILDLLINLVGIVIVKLFEDMIFEEYL